MFSGRWTNGPAAGRHGPTGAYEGAVKQLSGDVSSAENSTDVVSNVQFERCAVVFRPDHVVHGKRMESHAPRGWSTRAWRLLFQACFPKNDARLMMTVVLAVSSDTNDVAAWAVWESSLESASESSGRSRDSEIVCWCYERQRISECRKMQKDHDM